nr:MAG TPA: hypothetical protein [Caudoviricetes sp.]
MEYNFDIIIKPLIYYVYSTLNFKKLSNSWATHEILERF